MNLVYNSFTCYFVKQVNLYSFKIFIRDIVLNINFNFSLKYLKLFSKKTIILLIIYIHDYIREKHEKYILDDTIEKAK